MITGPGRPERARVNARRNTSGNALRRRNAESPLRHGLEGIEVRHFLQHAFGELLARAMAEDNHQGHAVGESIDDGGHRIASPRSLGHHGHSGLAATPGVTVGHEHGGLLVTRENQWNIIFLMKRIEQREDIVTRECGDELDSLGLENIDNRICDTHVCSYLFG